MQKAWQKHWSKVGMPGYELPVRGRGGQERDFLTQRPHTRKGAGRTASCAVAMLAVHARRGQV